MAASLAPALRILLGHDDAGDSFPLQKFREAARNRLRIRTRPACRENAAGPPVAASDRMTVRQSLVQFLRQSPVTDNQHAFDKLPADRQMPQYRPQATGSRAAGGNPASAAARSGTQHREFMKDQTPQRPFPNRELQPRSLANTALLERTIDLSTCLK